MYKFLFWKDEEGSDVEMEDGGEPTAEKVLEEFRSASECWLNT